MTDILAPNPLHRWAKRLAESQKRGPVGSPFWTSQSLHTHCAHGAMAERLQTILIHVEGNAQPLPL